jgi:hypothetical protein
MCNASIPPRYSLKIKHPPIFPQFPPTPCAQAAQLFTNYQLPITCYLYPQAPRFLYGSAPPARRKIRARTSHSRHSDPPWGVSEHTGGVIKIVSVANTFLLSAHLASHVYISRKRPILSMSPAYSARSNQPAPNPNSTNQNQPISSSPQAFHLGCFSHSVVYFISHPLFPSSVPSSPSPPARSDKPTLPTPCTRKPFYELPATCIRKRPIPHHPPTRPPRAVKTGPTPILIH